MSDTPRTNRVEDVIYYVGEVSLHFVKADFARTLERELAAVTAERDRMRMLLDCRLCKNYTTKSGGCTSVFTCVDASQFKASEPHRYWIEATK